VNYRHIADALDFYEKRGYVYLEDAPWEVFHGPYYATRPPFSKDVRVVVGGPVLDDHEDDHAVTLEVDSVDERFLVASGEQSFIQMMFDGQPIKRAICVTPCWREEPRPDTLHRRYFMKAELINAQDADEGHLIHMIHDACAFFEQFFSVRVVETDVGYDIVEKGTRYELGSYGIRSTVNPKTGAFHKWIYGTACAEPRLSTAIARHSRYVGR
jgi:hypothetical protein